MALPKPVPGLVIRYSYLWHREYLEGREDGQKDRPCAIVGPRSAPMQPAIRASWCCRLPTARRIG